MGDPFFDLGTSDPTNDLDEPRNVAFPRRLHPEHELRRTISARLVVVSA